MEVELTPPFNDLKAEILYRIKLHTHWNDDRCLKWYRTRNPLLSHNTPEELVDAGLGKQVLQFLRQAVLAKL